MSYTATLVDATLDIPPPPSGWLRPLPSRAPRIEDTFARIEAAAQQMRAERDEALNAGAELVVALIKDIPPALHTPAVRAALARVRRGLEG